MKDSLVEQLYSMIDELDYAEKWWRASELLQLNKKVQELLALFFDLEAISAEQLSVLRAIKRRYDRIIRQCQPIDACEDEVTEFQLVVNELEPSLSHT